MEIIDVNRKYNGLNADFKAYDIRDIKELEKGTIFGFILTASDFGLIFPYISVEVDSELTYKIFSDAMSNIEAFGGYSGEVLYNWKETPLLFKIIDDDLTGDYLAEELLTGEKYIFCSVIDYKDDDEMDVEGFYDNVKKYSDNNTFICNGDRPIFVVDDHFKYIYNDTLSRKDEVVNALKQLKQEMQKMYNDRYNECIDKVNALANTDNFLYDVEHKNKTSH